MYMGNNNKNMAESDKYRAKKCSDFKLFSWNDFFFIICDTVSFINLQCSMY